MLMPKPLSYLLLHTNMNISYFCKTKFLLCFFSFLSEFSFSVSRFSRNLFFLWWERVPVRYLCIFFSFTARPRLGKSYNPETFLWLRTSFSFWLSQKGKWLFFSLLKSRVFPVSPFCIYTFHFLFYHLIWFKDRMYKHHIYLISINFRKTSWKIDELVKSNEKRAKSS